MTVVLNVTINGTHGNFDIAYMDDYLYESDYDYDYDYDYVYDYDYDYDYDFDNDNDL